MTNSELIFEDIIQVKMDLIRYDTELLGVNFLYYTKFRKECKISLFKASTNENAMQCELF